MLIKSLLDCYWIAWIANHLLDLLPLAPIAYWTYCPLLVPACASRPKPNERLLVPNPAHHSETSSKAHARLTGLDNSGVYWIHKGITEPGLLHGRIANLEAQGLQQGGAAAGGEKRMSRAEEIDVANRVIDENFKEQQQRDANRAARVEQDVIADQPVQAGDRAFLRSPDPSLRLSPARGRSPSPDHPSRSGA